MVDAPAALQSGAAQLWEQAPSNLSYRFQKGDQAAVRSAIAGAAHVVEMELVNNRIVIRPGTASERSVAMTPMACTCSFSAAGVHALADATRR